MSDLKKELEKSEESRRVAEELLFIVLDYLGEPVVLDMERAKNASLKDRAIDIDFNIEAGTVSIGVVDIEDTV